MFAMKFSHQIYEIAIEVRPFHRNERKGNKFLSLCSIATKTANSFFANDNKKKNSREKTAEEKRKWYNKKESNKHLCERRKREASGERGGKKRLPQWHKEMTVGVERKNSSFWLSSTQVFSSSSIRILCSFCSFLAIAIERERKSERSPARSLVRSRTHSFHQVKMKTVYRKGIEIKGKIVCECLCERERERARTHNSYLSMLYWLPVWCVSLCVYGMNMIQFGWVRFGSVQSE